MAAFFGNRSAALDAMRIYSANYRVPPFAMISEYRFTRKADPYYYGNYVTGAGGLLSSVMLGFTGVRIGGDPRSPRYTDGKDPITEWAAWPASLPEGWDNITVDRMYMQGATYSMVAAHNAYADLKVLS